MFWESHLPQAAEAVTTAYRDLEGGFGCKVAWSWSRKGIRNQQRAQPMLAGGGMQRINEVGFWALDAVEMPLGVIPSMEYEM